MRTTPAIALALLIGLLAVACADPEPERTPTSTGVQITTAPEPSPATSVDDLTLFLGPWRPAPLPVSETMHMAFAAACAEQAAEAGIDAARLSPAVVDARGGGRGIIILGDDRTAVICEARIQPGPAFTFDGFTSRLAPGSVGPIAEDEIDIVGYTADDTGGGEGPRTLLYGRVGRLGFEVKIGFDDESEVFASKGADWYAAWWPGAIRPATIAAVDRRSVAVMGVDPGEYVEGRAGPGSWWVDPAAPPLAAESTEIQALVFDAACSSGQSPEGRILEPDIFASDAAFLITVWVRRLPGGQDCQGSPPAPFEIVLPEPLGDRSLLDGSETPPRDATIPVR